MLIIIRGTTASNIQISRMTSERIATIGCQLILISKIFTITGLYALKAAFRCYLFEIRTSQVLSYSWRHVGLECSADQPFAHKVLNLTFVKDKSSLEDTLSNSIIEDEMNEKLNL